MQPCIFIKGVKQEDAFDEKYGGNLKVSNNAQGRDTFRSRFGFIMACVGSAVGIGNIWLFPYRVGEYGGFAFLVPFIIFEVFLGFVGVVGEMAFGRAMRSGPHGAFRGVLQKYGKEKFGFLGVIPLIGTLGIAIGYTVIMGWVLRYIVGAVSGSLFAGDPAAYFGAISGPLGSLGWHILAAILTFVVLSAGVSAGIERASKVIMPAFFLIFVGLAIYVSTIPGAEAGYAFMFNPDWGALSDPKAWVYAMGQAFFSLSLAGCGTVVYGSYLSDKENVPFSALSVFLFDLIASILIAMVILPAVFAFGTDPQAGPPLVFIVLPQIFAALPAGNLIALVFFVSVFFAGITSMVNMYEGPIDALMEQYNMSRKKACLLVIGVSFLVGLVLENADYMGGWMDFISIIIMPFGALLCGIMFYWLSGKDFVEKAILTGSHLKSAKVFTFLGKYVYCAISFLVLFLGIILGGIG